MLLVDQNNQGVLVLGESQIGKSSLARELLKNYNVGIQFVSDDFILLKSEKGVLSAARDKFYLKDNSVIKYRGAGNGYKDIFEIPANQIYKDEEGKNAFVKIGSIIDLSVDQVGKVTSVTAQELNLTPEKIIALFPRGYASNAATDTDVKAVLLRSIDSLSKLRVWKVILPKGENRFNGLDNVLTIFQQLSGAKSDKNRQEGLTTAGSPVADEQDAYVTKPIVAPQEKIIGNIVLENGNKLYMRQGQEDNYMSVVFYNTPDKGALDKPVGFVDINTQESLINYIYIYKEFRGGNYSGDMTDAILAKMEDGTLTGQKSTFAKAYVRNPLMVKVLKDRGFDYIEDTRINITVVIPEERSIGKIPIFVENPNDRMVIEKQINDDPEWQGTFELVDKLEGRECVIFATYIHYFWGSSPLDTTSRMGGIDMRSLPQHTKVERIAVGSPLAKQGQPLKGVAAVSDKEWQEIERMASSGIAPSCERLREYLLSLQDPNSQIDKVLACIADILRQEEEKACCTEASLREILVLLESDKPVNELRLALAKVQVLAKEPQLIAQ